MRLILSHLSVIQHFTDILTATTQHNTLNMKPYLQPYKGKSSRQTCPNCGVKNSFTLYLDGNTHEPINSKVGICNRMNKCGYHYPPKQFFLDNPESQNIKLYNSSNQFYNPPDIDIPINYIPYTYVQKSISSESNFIDFLSSYIQTDIIQEVINEYRLGATRNREVIFWQIDYTGKVRTGKIMQYNPKSGKRIKHESGAINWIHKKLERQGKLSQDFNLAQCFFGEHLIKKYPNKTIAIVEAEKTAIIASLLYPQLIWLAAGNINGLTLDKCFVLNKKNVLLFPDLGIAYNIWKQKAEELTPLISWNNNISTLLEAIAAPLEKKEGYDIADYLLKQIIEIHEYSPKI